MNRVAVRREFDKATTDRRVDTTWWGVADYARKKMCHTRQRTGSCSCRRKNTNNNPCDHAEKVATVCEERVYGVIDASMTIETIREWILHHSCHTAQAGEECGHRACERVGILLTWLDAQRRRCASLRHRR